MLCIKRNKIIEVKQPLEGRNWYLSVFRLMKRKEVKISQGLALFNTLNLLPENSFDLVLDATSCAVFPSN